MANKKNHTGENFTETIRLDGEIIDSSAKLTIDAPIYKLSELEFEKLISLPEISSTVWLATFGLFLNILTKFIASFFDKNISINYLEIFIFIIYFIVAIISSFIPSKRKNIIKKIKKTYQ